MNKQQMIESVRNFLSGFGKVDERVLKAIEEVDRKDFMPVEMEGVAYIDSAMGIGYGQTISQPSTVARMLSLLELKKGDRVLEVGAGSGWNAALIGELVKPGKVLSLEVVKELVSQARKKIKMKNVEVREEDFRDLDRKFDKIIFTAGISSGQEDLIRGFAEKCLNEEGILVCPFQSGSLIVMKNKKGKIEKSYTSEEYVFVRLVL